MTTNSREALPMRDELLRLADELYRIASPNLFAVMEIAEQMRRLAARCDAEPATPEQMTPKQLAKRLAKGERWEVVEPAKPEQPQVLEWSATLCDGTKVDYAAAEKACTALGEGWRLPSRMELESILDLTRHDPAIDTTRFHDTKSGWYWTSTPCAWSSDYVWLVNFYNGYANDYGLRNSLGFVRAVRSVPAAPAQGESHD